MHWQESQVSAVQKGDRKLKKIIIIIACLLMLSCISMVYATPTTEDIETTTYKVTRVYYQQGTYYITAVNPKNPLDVWQLDIVSCRYSKKLLQTFRAEFIGQYVDVTYYVGDTYTDQDDEYIVYTLIGYSIRE